MFQPSSRFAVSFAIFACAAAMPAAAKDKEPAVCPVQIQELYACRDIADLGGAAGSLDREVGELATADSTCDISFADRATVKRPAAGYSASLPNLGALFGSDEEAKRTDHRIDSTIKAVSMDKSGKYRITLEDDALWADRRHGGVRQPQPGQKIKIKAVVMGSYFASVEGARSFRMRRERR